MHGVEGLVYTAATVLRYYGVTVLRYSAVPASGHRGSAFGTPKGVIP